MGDNGFIALYGKSELLLYTKITHNEQSCIRCILQRHVYSITFEVLKCFVLIPTFAHVV